MARLAVACVVRDEEAYLAEWLCFHALQGVDRFILYDNQSLDNTKDVALRFASDLNIEIVDWPLVTGHFDAHQRAAYRDAAGRLVGLADFVAFIDVDEFLFDRSGLDLPDSLDRFAPEVSAIAVQQNAFGSSNLEEYSPEPVIARFVRCGSEDNAERYWFKTIVRPERVKAVNSCHSVLLDAGRYVLTDQDVFDSDRPGHATRLSSGSLVLNHYIVKSLEEYRSKQARWADRAGFETRYNEGYFFYRTKVLNEFVDSSAAVRAPAVIAMMQKYCRT